MNIQQPLSRAATCRLASRNPYRTHDLDAARRHISELFKPHDLSVVGKNQAIDVCVGGVNLKNISLLYHRHGAHVSVVPEKLDEFFLLQIPVRGEARVRVDDDEVLCSPIQGVMISPTRSVEMEFMPGCEQFILRVDRSYFTHFFEQQLSRPLRRPLEFTPSVPLDNCRGQKVLSVLRYLVDAFGSEEDPEYPPFVIRNMASLLVSTLVSSLDHNYQSELLQEKHTLVPSHVKRAQRFMEESANASITPEDVALAVNTSPRALFAAFQRYLGTTPMRYLKNLRLDKAHQRLLQDDPSLVSVTGIALEFGFLHLGHFSAAYKERFGMLPSETVSRRRSEAGFPA